MISHHTQMERFSDTKEDQRHKRDRKQAPKHVNLDKETLMCTHTREHQNHLLF
jgi:hypothetical protein